ncbi:MAG: TIGR03560 family F420-dependent LLM class oxidoreductase [Candidatus Bathyarchaeota archaeon]|nr:TIGR03560 family F420-dependent LLM class oxidoreductase [Candidatus Bathyarchaeota archaeon]
MQHLTNPKFGVFLPFYAFHAPTPQEHFRQLKNIVLEAEQLGYDSVWLDDHLMYKEMPILESWSTLSALAAVTSRIRLGTMVTCNLHHNPAVLAKAAATLDCISDGRLEFGLGAGVQEAEHLAYGFGFPKAGVRVQMLREALEVVTALWEQKKATYAGKYYLVKDAVCEPKPLQKPHPPITVGGTGDKLLRVTAQYADRFDWGFLPSIDEYKRKLIVLEAHCNSLGRNPNEIERSCWPSGQILIAPDQSALTEKLAKYKSPNQTLEDYKKYTMTGTPKECIEQLQGYRNLGVSYFMLFFADLPNLEGLRVFAQEVAGKLC